MEQQKKSNSRRNFLQSLTAVGGATLTESLLPAALHAEAPLLRPANPLAGHAITRLLLAVGLLKVRVP